MRRKRNNVKNPVLKNAYFYRVWFRFVLGGEARKKKWIIDCYYIQYCVKMVV